VKSFRVVAPRPEQQHEQREELPAVVGLAAHVLVNEVRHRLGPEESRAAQRALLEDLVN